MNDTLLKACRGEAVDYTPVWLMRQAGRILPEYRAVAAQTDFLTMCRTPEIAAKVTIQPVDSLGVDAAIFFSDITTTMVPMGMELVFEEGIGPYFTNPVTTDTDVDQLIVPDEDDDGLRFVYEGVQICANELANKVPVIGFAGAPLTMASFMIEGAMSRSYVKFRRFLYSNSDTFGKLMDKISRHTANYLKSQARAGAQALMLFDSFAGTLGPRDFRDINLPYIKQIITDLKNTGLPVIYFGRGAHGSLDDLRNCGADVIAIDHGIDLDYAIAILGKNVAVQGNLDPFILFQSRENIERRVRDTLAQGKNAHGHIFNLGEGISPATHVDNVRAMVDAVHDFSSTST